MTPSQQIKSLSVTSDIKTLNLTIEYVFQLKAYI